MTKHKVNPNKLLHSKWTAVKPENKELHFMVTKLIRDEEETVIACELEAVINKNSYQLDWRLLTDPEQWRMGWK
ncbi:TIGR02450 family Trp-rich protein [Leucothrix sargassi]|nr:TIGR02450 family Trp-rich protein [Leucothrix sargassi]